MAIKYDDIIKLRGGKAAYDIAEEKQGEWISFIPNEQFNSVLRTVIKSVRGNDIDNHKSFWINGTYGTGKSHAVAVISHLLGDDVEDIREWVDYEYKDDKFATIRQAIYSLRETKRLLKVNVYGLGAMTHPGDLALVLQKAVTETLRKHNIEIAVPTDYENYIEQIRQNPVIWKHLIDTHTALSSVVDDCEQLIEYLSKGDLGVFHRVSDTLREAQLDIRLSNDNIKQWLKEIEDRLAELGTYNGLLIVWDEFTDVMTDAIGVPVLKQLQEVAQKFMNEDSNSYIFLISHPSAFNGIDSEQLKQTDGRYHRMKYNMESVSAFKIMSRKFEIIDEERHSQMCQQFYTMNSQLPGIFTATSNDQQSTREDLFRLYPLHPGTANLATHYATVVGSSSRSVFEFLGQNDSIREFLDSEEHFLNRDTITADYLWDYVLKVFQDDVANYGAVTERYNSYKLQVSNEGESYFAVFKGILLLNAFNNVSGENNNGLVTPSEDNIHALFAGTRYEGDVDVILQWFNQQGIIQRAPGGLFSVQFSALPSGEIEEKKNEMRNVQYRYTEQILNFSDAASTAFEKKMMQKVIRPYGFKFFSDHQNETVLRSQIKNARKDTKTSALFFALLMARNNAELGVLRSFAEKCAEDEIDKDLKNIVFIVFDEVFTDAKYEQFIEYQANYACASSHGFLDQQKVHRDHAVSMVKEWMDSVQRGNAIAYINGEEKQPISVKRLSSIVNNDISPTIFPYGPDACELLRQKTPSTFWRQQNSKEIVRTFIFATSKEELTTITAQMRPVQYLVQECLDDNMEWKNDVSETHPFKVVYDKVQSIIKYADKSLPFNFDDKFSVLQKPPYGLYGSFASMAMMAFALKPWANKIFDMQGKPRDKNALIDDIVWLFKVWDDKKSNSKLNFKFQTPEEGKLCKDLISLFKLNSKSNDYSDVTSLKDARYAITAEFLGKKGYPLWTLKYASEAAFDSLPVTIVITDEERRLIDNIVTICMERDLRNPALVKETIDLISELRYEMKNILNVDAAFSDGFKNYLMQLDFINIKEDEVDDVKHFIEQNLQSTVGYWTEEEVEKKALQWNSYRNSSVSGQHATNSDGWQLSGNMASKPSDNTAQTSGIDSAALEEKRKQAKNHIASITTIDDAKALLNRLCDECGELLLDIINS
ncbi:MAG: hypothetical protein SPF66_04110 [Bacteroidaceae bacterium]|nr:hypothetical protein [Bacteroidaceae bacterium]